MIESVGSFVKRKIIFPFSKMGIERKTHSLIGKGAYLYKGTTLEGRAYVADRAELANVCVGYGTYIGPASVISNTKIGRYSCIAGLETAIGRHPVSGENISVHPAFYSSAAQYGFTYVDKTTFEEAKFTQEGYNITIGSDVWIGRGVMICDGISVGDGAVVGARSLVLSDVEPYAIYAGSPAKKIGMRFDDETVSKLLSFRWWERDISWIREHAEEFADPAGFLDTIMKQTDSNNG